MRAAAQPVGERLDDLQIGPHARPAAASPGGATGRGPPGWSSCRLPRPIARPAARRRPRLAVSERNRSATTSKSRPVIRSASWRRPRARETSDVGGEHQQPAHARPPSAPSSSHADSPAPGRLSASTPQTAAISARCAGLSMLAIAGQLVGLLPVLATALAVALPGQAAVAAIRAARPCPARAPG